MMTIIFSPEKIQVIRGDIQVKVLAKRVMQSGRSPDTL